MFSILVYLESQRCLPQPLSTVHVSSFSTSKEAQVLPVRVSALPFTGSVAFLCFSFLTWKFQHVGIESIQKTSWHIGSNCLVNVVIFVTSLLFSFQ